MIDPAVWIERTSNVYTGWNGWSFLRILWRNSARGNAGGRRGL